MSKYTQASAPLVQTWHRATRTLLVLLAALSMVITLGMVSAPGAAADTHPVNPADPATPSTVSADALPTVQIDGVVWQQAIYGNTVYAVGSFTTARPAGAAPGTQTVTRNNILAYDLSTGALKTAFNANLNGQAKSIAISPDGSRIYVGGAFTTVNGQNRRYVAALNPSTGALITSWAPNVGSRVYALAATNDKVYMGGWFNNVGSAQRTKLAAVSASNAALLPWNPVLTDGGDVMAMELNSDGSKIVVGGNFKSVNGSTNPGWGMAMLSTDSVGSLLPFATNALVRNAGSRAAMLNFDTRGGMLYGVGYHFGGSDGNFEGTFASDWNTGETTWLEDCHGDTYGVYGGSKAVYTAGHAHYCGNIGAFPQTEPTWTFHHALAFGTQATGTITADPHGYFNFAGNPRPSLLAWYPEFTVGTFTGQSQAAWTVTGNDDYVVMGGEFPSVNGTSQQGLVRFATSAKAPNKRGPVSDGAALNPTVTSYAKGMASISWPVTWDMDNENLTYEVFRDGNLTTPIHTATRASSFWKLGTMTYRDLGLEPGSTHTYRVFATDPAGNIARSESVSATISSTGTISDYVSKIWQDGAQNYWRLGQASGSTSPNWAGSSVLNLASGTTSGRTGALPNDTDTATDFSGSSSGYAASGEALQGPDTFSAEAWVKTNSLRGGKIIGFGNAATGTSSSYDRHVYMSSTGRIYFGVYPGQVRTVNTSAGYNDNQWHHVVASMDSSGMKLYVDGQLQDQRTDTTTGQSYTGYWRVGGDSLSGWSGRGTSDYLNGTIDEVATYDKALSASQVAAHFALSSGEAANEAPTAKFTSTVEQLELSVDAAGSTDPDGAISEYRWDFGDGSEMVTDTQAKASHSYTTAGSYTVTLRVTDADGATDSSTGEVTVTANQAPTSAFTATTNELVLTVNAAGSADADGTITSYLWDFGDGTEPVERTTAQTTHSYAAGGDYTVSLTVTDDSGATDVATRTVNVAPAPQNAEPVAVFSVEAQDLKISVDAAESSDPDGNITGYSWNFGDGTSPVSGTSTTATHSYAKAGTYTVTLTVTDNEQATAQKAQDVAVQAPAGAGVLARDAFNRSLASGWGTADQGGDWLLNNYSTSRASVAGGAGELSVPAGRSVRADLPAVSTTDTVTTVKLQIDKDQNAGGFYGSVVGRAVPAVGDYQVKYYRSTNGGMQLFLQRVQGGENQLAAITLPSIGFTAGDELNIKLQVLGTTPTTLSAKAWKQGSTEPAAWQLTATDSTAAMQAPGGIAVTNYLSGSATNGPLTVSYLDLAVDSQ